eukprot:s2022_g13.t1
MWTRAPRKRCTKKLPPEEARKRPATRETTKGTPSAKEEQSTQSTVSSSDKKDATGMQEGEGAEEEGKVDDPIVDPETFTPPKCKSERTGGSKQNLQQSGIKRSKSSDALDGGATPAKKAGSNRCDVADGAGLPERAGSGEHAQQKPVGLGEEAPTVQPEALLEKPADKKTDEIEADVQAKTKQTRKPESTASGAPPTSGAAPTSSSPPELAPDVISSDPKFSQMMQTVQAASHLGEIRVQLKTQNKRSGIAVLMFKEPEGKKFTQKLQIVVKPPNLVGVDAMAIMKDIAADVLDGDLALENVRARRDYLVQRHDDGTLIDYFKERRPITQEENAIFVGIYAKWLALGVELSSDRQPDELPSFGLPEIDLPGHLPPDCFLAYICCMATAATANELLKLEINGVEEQPVLDQPAAIQPSLARAKEVYAKHNGLEVSAVTEDMLVNSDLGVEGWACHGMDCKARGPMGNQMYRQIKKNPKAAEAYKWLFDNLKLKFRQSWAMSRNFDFVSTKRIHTISTKTKQEEVGTWKNKLQLEAHYGGVGIPEAVRQAENYIKNCFKYEDPFWFCLEIFVMHNTWTDAENYLLVEKLVSKSEEEAWKEVAEKCDSSGTYETESYKCKAIRKYAIFHGLAWEGVTLEQVQSSSAGLAGWAEMNVAVPGIDATSKGPATPQTAEPSAPISTETENGKENGKGKGKNKRGRGKDQDSQEQGTHKTPKVTKPKKELSSLQTAEVKSKEILQFLQMSQQVMEKVAGSGDELPSEWRCARAFLEDYTETMARFKEALKPADGDELTDFVDDLKLNILGKNGIKTLKKSYGNRYEAMLTLFVDRCYSIASTHLGFLLTSKFS